MHNLTNASDVAEAMVRSRHAPRDEPSARQRFVKQPARHAERDGYVGTANRGC